MGAPSYAEVLVGDAVCTVWREGRSRRSRGWTSGTGFRAGVLGAAVSVAALLVLPNVAVAASARRPSPSWPANVFAVGTFHGITGNVSTTRRPTVATIQRAVDEAERWADAHRCGGAPCDTYVLLAPGDYKTLATRIAPAPPDQDAAGVLIDTDNVWLVGMERDSVVIDGTKAGPTCSDQPADQVFGPARAPHQGLNGVMVYKAAGTWVENLTVCNFLNGTGGDGGAGNQIWWNGGANSGVVYHDTQGGYHGNYLTATSTYYPGENPDTGVSTDLSSTAEDVAASYGIFSSNWDGGSWDYGYTSNFNDSGYYIGACQDECNQTVDHAWAQFSALGYSGSNSGGVLVVEHSTFSDNEDGFDTNSQNGDNPPPQNGACPAGVKPPVAGAATCWVFTHNDVTDNNDPDVPTYGSAAAGPVGTGMSISGARDDTVLDNTFTDNGAWGTILVPYPDSGPPCSGGTQVLPGSPSTPLSDYVCLFDEYGDAVIGNHYAGNGFFGNPTNGDIGATNLEPGPTDCFSGNTDPKGLTTAPPGAELFYPKCTGATVPPDLDPLFLDEVACDSGSAISVVGPVTGADFCLPGSSYPRQTEIVMHPLPGAKTGRFDGHVVPALENPQSTSLPTMPDLCSQLIENGMGTNPWCPSGDTTAARSSTRHHRSPSRVIGHHRGILASTSRRSRRAGLRT